MTFWRKLIGAGLAIVVFVLTGCGKPAPMLNVTVDTTDAKGLQVDDPVVYNGVTIGKVSAVEPTSVGATVLLALDPAKSNVVRSQDPKGS